MRKYRVADHVFGVELDSPWQFMEYTPSVQARIENASQGNTLEVIPIRAGDKVPSRTFVQAREELPEGFRQMFDFSQYEPFLDTETPDEDLIFTMRVHACLTPEIEQGILSQSKIILKCDEYLPWYYVRMKPDGRTSYEFFPMEDKSVGIMEISSDRSSADFYPREGFRNQVIFGQISTALMLMYTYATASKDTLLLHASVVRHEGKANLFFGKSGTGKSTHARLWVDNIPGCDLINDDNPVVRYLDGKFIVFGTPWSGKTPCYRNVSCEIRSLVNLEQGPANVIRQISGLEAYVGILSSSSRVKWIREDADVFVRMVEKLAMGVESFKLQCLPDKDAAVTSLRATEHLG